MTDSSEFKQLVRQRMDATGEKYTVAYRALLDAARVEVLPLNLRVLPRISAKYIDNPAKPLTVRLHLFRAAEMELDEEELQRYEAADQDEREQLVQEWLLERIQDWGFADEMVLDHDLVYEDQARDRRLRYEAFNLGITGDQYAWLLERLTDEELDRLSDKEMHLLLAREYRQYSTPE